MTGVHINWWSFVPIFFKLDKDIIKMKKTFLIGWVNWKDDGDTSNGVGIAPNISEIRAEENLSYSLKLQTNIAFMLCIVASRAFADTVVTSFTIHSDSGMAPASLREGEILYTQESGNYW